MKGKVYKVTRGYNLAICGADAPRPIPIKFCMRVAPLPDQCFQFLS